MADRIQSALAKARARRAALAERSKPSGPGLPARTDTGQAWAQLPQVRCRAAQLARSRVFAQSAGDASMPFDMLRTRLLGELRANDWRRVAITSPDSGSGKTTVAINLALSLARQPDLRCVLIEADLQHPTLAGMLGIQTPPQFSRVLDGTQQLPEQLLRMGDNLCLALNGAPVQGAAELLQNPRVPAVLDRLERDLAPDVVFFDLPPMLQGDDTLGFLDKVDCALLVVAADSTAAPDIELCVQDLARHTNALGVVLNKLRHGAERGHGAYGG
jgi:protein-tyrosine kinase